MARATTHNRKSRRAQGSSTRRAVKRIAKEAGVDAPTAEEKDPLFLALQVRSLVSTVNQLAEAHTHNVNEIKRAFAMNDANQQIMQRVLRDVATVAAVSGSVGLGALRMKADMTLDLPAYYEEYRKVGVEAGDRDADLAVK